MRKVSFGDRVRAVVGKISSGKTLTYREVARRAGITRAARAVGNILAKNFNPHIPCHRVIRSDGSAGGYNRGRERKISLLRKEVAMRRNHPRSIIRKSFFLQPTIAVARNLLGKFLVRRAGKTRKAVMVTEVEAYDGPRDKASHANRGVTPRTKVMFREGGHFYVYFTYGMHWLLNVVTGGKGYPAAVLFRAGIALSKKGKWRRVAGPALLTRHLRVSGALNCKSVSKRTGLWLEDRSIHIKPSEIVRGKRVGVDYAGKKWAAKPYNFRISEPRIKRIVRSFSCQGGGVIDARS